MAGFDALWDAITLRRDGKQQRAAGRLPARPPLGWAWGAVHPAGSGAAVVPAAAPAGDAAEPVCTGVGSKEVFCFGYCLTFPDIFGIWPNRCAGINFLLIDTGI